MTSRRRWLLTIPVALGLCVAACRDAIGPLPQRDMTGLQADFLPDWFTPCILQQASTAPPLETYQVSFWARHDRVTAVAVNYTSGEPYLRFRIPRSGLKWTPGYSWARWSRTLLTAGTT